MDKQNGNPAAYRNAWRIAFAGLMTLATAMGIGRFAFTPLLPMMLHDGTITLNYGGWLATANYLGYFAGALLCAAWRGLPPIATIRAGLLSTIALTLGMGLLDMPSLWLLMRFVSGVASALVFVYGASWCLQQLTNLGYPAMGGIIFCGPGLGIMLTGLASGSMVSHNWSSASGWLAFGALAIVLTLSVWRIYHDDHHPQPIAASQQPAIATVTETNDLKKEVRLQILAYGLSGFGYIITATFLPVIAREALPNSAWPDFFWPLFGLCVALGAFGATRFPVQWDQRKLLAGSYLTQACGVTLSVVLPTETGFALSSALLGLPFTAITLFAMREARRLRPEHSSSLMGLLTAAYGLGQIAGPPLATQLVHQTGSFTPSLNIAAAALLLGALLYYSMARAKPTAVQ